MSTKYTDLPAAGALDGSEVLAVVIPPYGTGDSRQTTTQAIADLASPAGGNQFGRIEVATAGGTITLALGDFYQVVARGDASISGAKFVAYTDGDNCQDWYLYIPMTNAATLEFPDGTVIGDPRFDLQIFTPYEEAEEGIYIFHLVGDIATGFIGGPVAGPITS